MFNWLARLATEMKADKVIDFLFDGDDLAGDCDCDFDFDFDFDFELAEA